MTRILTAAVLLPLLWLALKKAPPLVFQAIVLLVMTLAVWECYALLAARGSKPLRSVGLATCFGVAVSYLAGPAGAGPGPALALGTFAIAAVAMARFGDPAAMLDSALTTLFPVLLVGLPFGCTIGLRSIPGEDATDLILLMLVCVMASDTAAYYVGSWIGRHKMAPVLSPKKSWEGAFAGIAAGVGGGVLAHLWFYRGLPLRHAVTLGFLLACAGIVGDLAESMVKRAAGAKDSARILPGHGGFFDRTDSLLFASPLLYYYFVNVLGAGP
jgi:phosphatidate cytidylyltransferase